MPPAEADPAPAGGRLHGKIHLYPVRVFYEDTDLSGIVYHANYLRFMERARSDLLLMLNVDQRAAQEAGIGTYAVADIAIRYLKPARLGDALVVETRCTALGGASVTMEQNIRCGPVALTMATLRVGFITLEGRPRRQPPEWIESFHPLIA